MGKSKTTLTSKERITGLLYVLLLFSVTSFVCAYILFINDSDYHFAKSKKDAIVQLERVKSFRDAQSDIDDQLSKIDALVNKINPALNASYEKRELSYLLGEVRKVYTDNKYDDRYRIYNIVADFYEMRVFERERLFASEKNIETFQKLLDNCRAGMDKLQNE